MEEHRKEDDNGLIVFGEEENVLRSLSERRPEDKETVSLSVSDPIAPAFDSSEYLSVSDALKNDRALSILSASVLQK